MQNLSNLDKEKSQGTPTRTNATLMIAIEGVDCTEVNTFYCDVCGRMNCIVCQTIHEGQDWDRKMLLEEPLKLMYVTVQTKPVFL